MTCAECGKAWTITSTDPWPTCEGETFCTYEHAAVFGAVCR